MTIQMGYSSASNRFKLVSLEEVVLRCYSAAEATGRCELYLHNGEWVFKHQPDNSMADDHIVTIVPKLTRRHDIEVRVLEAMLAEVRT